MPKTPATPKRIIKSATETAKLTPEQRSAAMESEFSNRQNKKFSTYNQQGEKGEGALHWAFYLGNMKAAKYMVEKDEIDDFDTPDDAKGRIPISHSTVRLTKILSGEVAIQDTETKDLVKECKAYINAILYCFGQTSKEALGLRDKERTNDNGEERGGKSFFNYWAECENLVYTKYNNTEDKTKPEAKEIKSLFQKAAQVITPKFSDKEFVGVEYISLKTNTAGQAAEEREVQRSLNRDLDDSSDEEEVENKIRGQYDLSKQDKYNNDDYVFIAHAFGTALLYSHEANKEYYAKQGLKEKYFRQEFTKEILKNIISKTLEKTINMFCISSMQDDIAAIRSNILRDAFYRQINCQQITIKKMQGEIKISINNQDLISYFSQLMIKQITDYSATKNKSGKTEDLHKQLEKMTLEAIAKMSGSIAAGKAAQVEYNNPWMDQVQGYPYSFEKRKIHHLNPREDQESLLEQVKLNFIESFQEETRNNLKRFNSGRIENAHGLFAGMRAINRFSKIRGQKIQQDAREIVDANDEYCDLKYKSPVPMIVNIRGKLLTEESSINIDLNRQDLLFQGDEGTGGSYPEHSKKIKKLKNTDDREIALLIRRNLNQNKNVPSTNHPELEVEKFAAKLTYLLFGTEANRNPASLIINQLMLDFIIRGDMKFEHFFGSKEYGQLMPMAPLESVSRARDINNQFKDFMPWPYEYDASKGKDGGYLHWAENNIISAWLEKTKISPKMFDIAMILSCKKWYDIDLSDSLYPDRNTFYQLAFEKFSSLDEPKEGDIMLHGLLQQEAKPKVPTNNKNADNTQTTREQANQNISAAAEDTPNRFSEEQEKRKSNPLSSVTK